MAALADFSAEEKALLISLPYKVGVWIGDADDIEGAMDDALETRALEHCIQVIARRHKDKPLIQEITAATLAARDRWPGWAAASFHVPEEAARAMALVKAKGTLQNAKNLRLALMEIAATVARASDEFSAFDEMPAEEGFVAGIIHKAASAFAGLAEHEPGHPMNVSAAEDSALSRLSAALKVEDAA